MLDGGIAGRGGNKRCWDDAGECNQSAAAVGDRPTTTTVGKRKNNKTYGLYQV